MLEALARRNLQKAVERLLKDNGAVWCAQVSSLKRELLKRQPKQQDAIEMLCRVVESNGYAYLLSLPAPDADQAALERVTLKVQEQGGNAEQTKWAVQCWATVLTQVLPQKRAEALEQLKAQRRAELELQDRARMAVSHQEDRRSESKQQQKIALKRSNVKFRNRKRSSLKSVI